MDVFEKLKNGEPVDMMSEEYRPAIVELHRADKALFHLNHAEPGSEDTVIHRIPDFSAPEAEVLLDVPDLQGSRILEFAVDK